MPIFTNFYENNFMMKNFVKPPDTFEVTSNGNILDEVYHAFSIRVSSLANHRPIWTFNFAVDQISFYIGGFGGVCLAYLMDQYEPMNIDNLNYINQDREQRSNVFMGLVNHIVTNPFSIARRFFGSGLTYIMIGLATSRMFKGSRWGRTFACGGLTGLYFSSGGSFMQMVKGTTGFAGYSLLMEAIIALTMS